MAAQSRGSVKVLVHEENDSLEAIAILLFSSRSVRTWNSSSAPRRSSSIYPSWGVMGCRLGRMSRPAELPSAPR
jgi:hypothetical protein